MDGVRGASLQGWTAFAPQKNFCPFLFLYKSGARLSEEDKNRNKLKDAEQLFFSQSNIDLRYSHLRAQDND